MSFEVLNEIILESIMRRDMNFAFRISIFAGPFVAWVKCEMSLIFVRSLLFQKPAIFNSTRRRLLLSDRDQCCTNSWLRYALLRLYLKDKLLFCPPAISLPVNFLQFDSVTKTSVLPRQCLKGRSKLRKRGGSRMTFYIYYAQTAPPSPPPFVQCHGT